MRSPSSKRPGVSLSVEPSQIRPRNAEFVGHEVVSASVVIGSILLSG